MTSPPPRRSPPVWAFVSAAWLGPAILAGFTAYMQARLGKWADFSWRWVVWEGGDWLIYALLTPFVFMIARRFHWSGGTWPGACRCISWPPSCCAEHGPGLGTLLRWSLFPLQAQPTPQSVLSWFFTSLPFGVAVYFAVLGVEHAAYYFLEARERETQAARLSAQLAEARLGALRMQLQPHFLFNSLNAITVIVRDRDTATATRMLEQLGEMLRRVMRTDRPQEVPLAEELEFVRQYLAIEEIRFSDRLRPVFEVDSGASSAPRPRVPAAAAGRERPAPWTRQTRDGHAAQDRGPAGGRRAGPDGDRRRPGAGRHRAGAARRRGTRPTPASGSPRSTATGPGWSWPPTAEGGAAGGDPAAVPRTCGSERSRTMAEIRALIVDDEPLARRGIRQLLAPYRDIAVVGECRDGREALRALTTLTPDLVFLDIQMPGLDGLGVIRLHGVERMPAVVFVTAHDEFAVRAFDAQALDYLVKPLERGAISRDDHPGAGANADGRCRGCSRRALGALLAKRRAEHRGSPQAPLPRPGGRAEAAASRSRRRRAELLIDAGEIDWIEAQNDQSPAFTPAASATGSANRSRLSRPARSGAVHPRAPFGDRAAGSGAGVGLARVRRGRKRSVVLRDGTRLPVSRRRLAQVKALLRPPARRS